VARKNPPQNPQLRRRVEDLRKLPRSAALSHVFRAKEAATPPGFPPAKLFVPQLYWKFFRSYLGYLFTSKHYFPDETASPTRAMFDMTGDLGSDRVRIAMAGDWATGTEESQRVAENMLDFEPHYTIHLGDVYYVGGAPEVNENFLGIRNSINEYKPVTWPVGKIGSFALNGNHEMYANGTGYFEMVLPNVGLRRDACRMQGQQTSFFCLQNQYWRVIAIDTGYNSVGVPVLGLLPSVNHISWIGGGCKLRPELMQWLEQTVKPQQDNRGLVLLAHHQYYSGFEKGYRVPAQQLWQAGVQRHAVWFWGHEHRMAGYDLYGSDDLKVFGRCLGHGGMPVEIRKPKHDPMPKFYDNRENRNVSTTKEKFGMNGHVNLEFSGPTLKAGYVDLHGKELLREEWQLDASGNCRQTVYEPVLNDPDFHV
jgi:hypothetical protein